eukprot:4655588-Prymnesium_polylepis.1
MFLPTRDGGRGEFVRVGASFGGRSGLYSVEMSIQPCETYGYRQKRMQVESRPRLFPDSGKL